MTEPNSFHLADWPAKKFLAFCQWWMEGNNSDQIEGHTAGGRVVVVACMDADKAAPLPLLLNHDSGSVND